VIRHMLAAAIVAQALTACATTTAESSAQDEVGYQQTFRAFLDLCQRGNRFGHVCDAPCRTVTEAAAKTGVCEAASEASVRISKEDPAAAAIPRCLVRCDPRYAAECPPSDNCDCAARCFGPLATRTLAAFNEELACQIAVESRTPACN
jgi:hypothetical protein